MAQPPPGMQKKHSGQLLFLPVAAKKKRGAVRKNFFRSAPRGCALFCAALTLWRQSF